MTTATCVIPQLMNNIEHVLCRVLFLKFYVECALDRIVVFSFVFLLSLFEEVVQL